MKKSPRCSTAPDDLAEAYWLSRLPQPEAESLENHYLLCPDCARRLEGVLDFIASFRAALMEEGVVAGMRVLAYTLR